MYLPTKKLLQSCMYGFFILLSSISEKEVHKNTQAQQHFKTHQCELVNAIFRNKKNLKFCDVIRGNFGSFL